MYVKKDFTPMLNHYLVQLDGNKKIGSRGLTAFEDPKRRSFKYHANMDMLNMAARFPQFIRKEKDADGHMLYSLTLEGVEEKKALLARKPVLSRATPAAPAQQNLGLRIVASTPEGSLSDMDAHYRALFRTLQELPKGSEVAVVFYKV